MDGPGEYLQRRLQREHLALKQAEAIAEQTSRELYTKGLALEAAIAAETQARRDAETLRDALEAFTAGLHVDDIVRHLGDFLERLVVHDGRAIYVVEGGELRLRATSGMETAGGTRVDDSAPESLLADIRRATHPIVVRSPTEAAERAASWRLPVTGAALMVVPMQAHGHATGCLALCSPRDDSFDTEGARLAKALANEAGLALENAHLFAEVERLSETDALTGLHNRRHFTRESGVEWERCRRHGLTLSALMVDIDHFKRFNDSFGHAAGDRVLVEVAGACRRSIRLIDLDVRYGGEEFCFLLPETGLEQASVLAERLRTAVGGLRLETDDGPLAVTVSIGVAERAEHDDSVDALLRRADRALYEAKRLGRDRVVAHVEPPR